ncbi:MAG TPA: hypothetical protein VG742_10650 [Dongiaceae bacterium]|nr:hypothetical protein [Dongiaceae bacterium]
MNRRLQLWLGVSVCALLGVTALPAATFAGPNGGQQGNSHDIDPNGGFQNECGEAGGCAEAGESFESTTPDELGEDGHYVPPGTAQPRSHGHGLSDGDSVSGRVGGGGSLGGSSGGLGD